MSRTPQPFTLDVKFSLEQPLDYEDGRDAAREFAKQRAEARLMLESAYAEQAQAENEYRQARNRARARAPRLERGEVSAGDRDDWVDAETSDEREARDRAKFKVEIIDERLAEIDATRASFHRLLEWSAAVDPAAQEDRSPRRGVGENLDRLRERQQRRKAQ